MGVFPCMEEFLNHLKGKNYQKRKIAIIENGSWSPSASNVMKSIIENMRDIKLIEPTVTIKSTMSKKNEEELSILAENLLK